MQTDWFQGFLVKRVIVQAKEQGILVDVQKMKALAPFKWKIEETSFELNSDTHVKASGLEFKISPLSMLRKKLTIKYFSASAIHLSFNPSSASSNSSSVPLEILKNIQNASFSLPFDLYVKNIACEKLSIENTSTHETLEFSAEGRVSIDQKGKEIYADLLLEETHSANHIEIVALSSLKDKNLEATMEVKIENEKPLALFLDIPNIPRVELTCKVNGKHKHPLSFEVLGRIDSLNLPNTECLIEPIKIHAAGELSLNSKNPFLLAIKKSHIQDKDLDLSASFILSHEYRPLLAEVSLVLKETSNLSCILPFKGQVEASIFLDNHSFLTSIHSPSLTVEDKTYGPVDFYVSATKENNLWKGSSRGTFDHPIFPIIESCNFHLREKSHHFETLDILDMSLSIADAKIGGSASYAFENNSYVGAFFIMAEELRPFRFLFPKSEIDGKLGGSFSVAGNSDDLDLNVSCLFKNIRYRNSLIHSVNVEAKFNNLLTKPFGTFSYDAKNIFFRDMLLSSVSLQSVHSPDKLQSFSLDINGDWKQEIQLHSTGLWKKEGPHWKVDLNTCEGSFLNQSFALQNPFEIENNEIGFLLTPCNWKVGEGDLSAEFSLTKEEMSLKGEGKHVPLGILGVLYPKMAFNGTASFQTAISGPKDKVKGHFFAALEKADFSQNRAKGSLQIHFNPSGAQIYTHLYATKKQFLDFTATLPLDYSYSPFSWQISPTRPITGELTMQGAVEDIFDFVNTASHKATGWITSHLFLSGSLEHPSLLGSLQCEKGSYENYFAGTQLKEVKGELEASSNTIKLAYLESSDDKNGTLHSEGALLLSPSKGFPFELKTELNQMHVVHSDFIDASSTGFLEIIGDKNSATASGTLTVDKAIFKIFDDLPYEVPELPVTFINKPIYLQTSTLQTSTPYPLNIDIKLEAEDSVEVLGRGLKSSWYGNVHLTGTLANPTANGTLTLEKGEFVFSGKTFILKQGEISFSDKPNGGATLKINGELPLSSATILAQMQGQLTSPQITFQAIPTLPTSSILSLILFDKDISEISALQALQLAQTVVSLSGKGGPGVLESIRKKIGVDRLNIVGKDGTDEIAVQIGWYLSHGITLSLSQSATSADVTVEVDLKNGFIFQAETQNREEGKFSLKWNKNY